MMPPPEADDRPLETGTCHTLPFEKLSPFDFERLCLWLVRREGFERVEHLGASGGEQSRDIVAWKKGRHFVFQCKRTRSFTAADARREIDVVRTLPVGEQPDELVFVATCSVSAKARKSTREYWGSAETCHFWTGTEIDELVRRHPQLVAIFFRAIACREPLTSRLFVAVPALPSHRLVGRTELLADIRACLRREGGSVVCVLHGMPGVGKTALALALAYDPDIVDHFAGGVLWASLGPHADVLNVLNEWAAALGLTAATRNLEVTTRTQQIVNALRASTEGKPVLLILDDVWTWDDAAAFRRISVPRCVWLVTTRDAQLARRLSGDVFVAGELAPESAEEFLVTRCPPIRSLGPRATADMVAMVGGLPLALSLIAGELNAAVGQERWVEETLTHLRTSHKILALQNSERRIGLLDVPNSLLAIVEMSLGSLTDAERAAFVQLGAFAPKPASFSREAAHAVCEMKAHTGDRILRSLVSRSLLEIAGEDRFTLHQILSAVAATRMPTDAPLRHARHYSRLAASNRDDWIRVGTEVEQIRRGWTFVNGSVNYEREVITFSLAMTPFFHRRGKWADCLDWNKQALTVAESLDLREDRVVILNNVGKLVADRADKKLSLVFYVAALRIIDKDDPFRKGIDIETIRKAAMQDSGQVPSHDARDQFQTRLNYAWSQAHAVCTESLFLIGYANDLGAKAVVLNNIALVQSAQGEKREALELYLRALECVAGFPEDGAVILNNFAKLLAECGETTRALEFCAKAQEWLDGPGGDVTHRRAAITSTLAEIHARAGNKDEALRLYDVAIRFFRDLGDRQAAAATLTSIASLYAEHGEDAKALAVYHETLALFKPFGDWSAQVFIVSRIAMILVKQGKIADAIALTKEFGDFMNEVRQGDLPPVFGTEPNPIRWRDFGL